MLYVVIQGSITYTTKQRMASFDQQLAKLSAWAVQPRKVIVMAKTDERDERRAALFPVVSEKSGEKRAISILLACLEQVPELAATLLEGTGPKIGPKTTVQAWTEVGPQAEPNAVRPDGKLVVITGKGEPWTALLEAKIGTEKLEQDQIEKYLKYAKDEKLQALITISNDFAILPTHHPTYRSQSRRGPKSSKEVSLLHWSWGAVLTKCQLLIDANKVKGHHRWVLVHLIRFLTKNSDTKLVRHDVRRLEGYQRLHKERRTDTFQ